MDLKTRDGNDTPISSGDDVEFDESEWDVVNAENEMEKIIIQFDNRVNDPIQSSEDISCHSKKVCDNIQQLVEDRLADVTEAYETRIKMLNECNMDMNNRLIELEHLLKISYEDKSHLFEQNLVLKNNNFSLKNQMHSMSEEISKLRFELENISCANKNLEKNTVQLENVVEETLASSQTGHQFLCETRNSVTEITKNVISLRNFLVGEASGTMHSEPTIGFTGGTIAGVMADLVVTLSIQREMLSEINAEARRNKSQIGDILKKESKIDAAIPNCTNKISLNNFKEGDLVWFFPTPKGDYVAFNIGTPHHYLSQASKELIGHVAHFKKVYVLGRIVMKEQKTSTVENSAYNLKPGCVYYDVSVESIEDIFPQIMAKAVNSVTATAADKISIDD